MTEASPDVPQQLGSYRILREIGAGQMGTVYEAIHSRLDRPVALKVLHPPTPDTPHMPGQLVREARSVARMEHPNIVTVHDAGEVGRFAYIAMKLLDGEDLQAILDRSGSLPVSRTLRIAAQLAQALDYAHTREIVHLDVKPANVMVGRGDHVTLTDFGIARAPLAGTTHSPLVTGTPRYMSPEQCLGQPVDCRSDIYSLGLLMYHMCAGHTPFAGRPIAVMYAQVHTPVPDIREVKPEIPAALATIIARALAKEAVLRFQTAAELYRALERAARAAEEQPASSVPSLFQGNDHFCQGAPASSPLPPVLSPAFFAGDATLALGPPPDREDRDPVSSLSRSRLPTHTASLGNSGFKHRRGLLAGSALAAAVLTVAALFVPARLGTPPARASGPPPLALAVRGLHEQGGEYTSGQRVTLRWSEAPGAAIYRLQIARRVSARRGRRIFDGPHRTELVEGRSLVTRVVGHQIYYWRVQPQVQGTWAAYSTVHHFTVAKPVIDKPALLLPRTGTSTTATRLRLCWARVKYAVSYRIQVSGLPAISSRNACVGLQLRPGEYSWRVSALARGVWLSLGPSSARWNFTVLARPTPAPLTPTAAPRPRRAAPTVLPFPTEPRYRQPARPTMNPTGERAVPHTSRIRPTTQPTVMPWPTPTSRPLPTPTPCDPELDPC